MGEGNGPVELTKGVYWVGAVDWNLRDFHGYETPKGGTYNSYLIVDDKVTLIDTVKAPFAGEMIRNISKIIDPSKIDYVIVNHVEPDHSSSMPSIMRLNPDAKIFATKRGKTGICEYYEDAGCGNWDIEVVETGSEISIGERTLMFIETVMLHWPDSMHTYLKQDRILFSNDAFGQHVSTSARFNDETDEDFIDDASEYYANILMPFGLQVNKYVDKVKELGIEIDMIAPAHGIIWRKDPQQIIDAYAGWASGRTVPKILVIYDSMWGSTEKMARAIVEGISAHGVEVKLMHLRKNPLSLVIKEILEAPLIAVGSTTINNGMLHTVAGFLTHLKGLRPKGKKAFVFGSYGWGGGGVKAAQKELEAAGFELIEEEPIQVKFRPNRQDLDTCRQMGKELAIKVIENKED